MLNRLRAPPEKMSRNPKMVPACDSKQLFQRFVIDARSRNKRSHAVNRKQAEHEQHALAQVRYAENILNRT